MAKRGTLLHYWNVHSQTTLMVLLSQIQSLRNSILISRSIYFHIYLSHLTSPCWAHKVVTDRFLPAVGETLPSTCSRAACPQTSEIMRQLSLGQSSQCKGADTRTGTEEPSQSGTSPPFPSLWTSNMDRALEKYLGTWPWFLWELCRFPWPVIWKSGITTLLRRVMTSHTSNISRLYFILCQWYSEIPLPLFKYPNLSFFLTFCKK